MKIAIDLRAGGWLGGRYYLQNLILALRDLPDTERPELVGLDDDESPEDFAGLLPIVRFLPDDADIVFPNWNVPFRTHAAQLHWIPDLQHRRLRRNFSSPELVKREVAFVRFAVRARRIVVSSEAVRRDAVRAYPPFARRYRVLRFCTVVPAGIAEVDAWATAHRYGITEPFVLLPNQFWVHKNHRVVWDALDRIDRLLICTGAGDDHRRPGHFESLRRELVDRGQEERVRLLGVVPRADYLQLVRAADALLQPSLFEGWSSTVEDARAFGKAVALSDIAVHREQNAPGGRFFDPHSPADLGRALEQALASAPPLREHDALAAQAERVVSYGRAFAALAREACT